MAEPFFGFISVRCLLLLDVLAHEKKDHVDVHLENTVPPISLSSPIDQGYNCGYATPPGLQI